MFRNALASALRNLANNRLYAAISIGGLAVGLAAAILTFLFVRDELSFDSFIPGHDKVFVLVYEAQAPGIAHQRETNSIAQQAAWLRLDFPQIADAERLTLEGAVPVERGDSEANETVGWADPGLLRLLPYPAIAGDVSTALDRPDGLVLTRAMARKYFGSDKPIGQTLTFGRKDVYRVSAVIADPPSSANITAQIFASGLSARSFLARSDAKPYQRGSFDNSVRTYVRLHDPRQVDEVNRAFPAYVSRRMAPPDILKLFPPGSQLGLSLMPIARMHLFPDQSAQTPPGSPALILGLITIAGLILGVAGVNFVNLMTARAGRRAVEVGVRKVLGAARRHLVIQFLGEAQAYAIAAAACALCLVELLLPALGSLMQRHIAFSYWRDLGLLGFIVALTVLVGVAAGAYPAFVLSSFRPASALHGGTARTNGSRCLRQTLVAGQFSVLVLLILGVLVVQAQTRFVMTQAAGLDKDGLLRISNAAPCRGAFVDAVARLPGVRSAVCESGSALGMGGENNLATILPGGAKTLMDTAAVDFGFFEQVGLKPLAGRLPSPARGEDALPFDPARKGCFSFGDMTGRAFPATITVNRAMTRAMGLTDPAKAIGATLRIHVGREATQAAQITGVVPDFALDVTRGPVLPSAYYVDANCLNGLTVKIAAANIPSTTTAIHQLWKTLGAPTPIRERFVDDYMRLFVYAAVIRQGVLLAALAATAVLIGALGLFALAAFTAEQRTKEIGVRKAMGASTGEVLGLLVWSFTRPVVLANLIAWPVGWWLMDRWLQGFAARIVLSPVYFLAAGGAALLIAILTVSGHALRVASAKPVGALRYE